MGVGVDICIDFQLLLVIGWHETNIVIKGELKLKKNVE